jgi:hypothetical protein
MCGVFVPVYVCVLLLVTRCIASLGTSARRVVKYKLDAVHSMLPVSSELEPCATSLGVLHSFAYVQTNILTGPRPDVIVR